MFNLNTWGLDDEWFMTGMWDLMLGTIPSTIFSSLIAILAPFVGKHIHEVTAAMAALGDIARRLHEGGGKNVHEVMSRPQRGEKKKKGPGRVSFL